MFERFQNDLARNIGWKPPEWSKSKGGATGGPPVRGPKGPRRTKSPASRARKARSLAKRKAT